MSRLEDIGELLRETDQIFSILEKAYETAKSDVSISSLPKVKVKSYLEHLRSILDYSAMDIYEYVYSKPAGKIYFPYSKNKLDFKKSVQRNFPGLMELNGDVYAAVESIQPHAEGSKLLYNLCKLTNDNKHQKLTEQKKLGRPLMRRVGPIAFPLAEVGAKKAQIVMIGCTFNGLPMGSGHRIEFDSGMPDIDILQQFHPLLGMKIVRMGGNVRFNLDETGQDVLAFLVDCRALVGKYVDGLYGLLR